jgi:hypothetical protein
LLELVSVVREQLAAERARGDRLELLLLRVQVPVEVETLGKLTPIQQTKVPWSERAKELTKRDRERAQEMIAQLDKELA